MQLGIPGLDFVTESKRFYPGGNEASHILGAVNIDNQGIAGIEKDMDDEGVALLQSIGLARGNELAPVNLSVDLRVQHVMHEVLADAHDALQGDRGGRRDDGRPDRRDHRRWCRCPISIRTIR